MKYYRFASKQLHDSFPPHDLSSDLAYQTARLAELKYRMSVQRAYPQRTLGREHLCAPDSAAG